MAYAPLVGQDGGSHRSDLPDGADELFLRGGLDRLLVICPSCHFVAIIFRCRHWRSSACAEPKSAARQQPATSGRSGLPLVQACRWPIGLKEMAAPAELAGDARYSSITGLLRIPSFSISTSTTSPAFRKIGGLRVKPTPAGVPVAITSPATRSKISDE